MVNEMRRSDLRLMVWIAVASVAVLAVQNPAEATTTTNGGTAYAQECHNGTNKVLLPPAWSQSNWKENCKANLNDPNRCNTSPSYTQQDTGEVWYASPLNDYAGLCMAFTRVDSIDVICQSATTGKACFWEGRQNAGNLPPRTPPKVGDPAINLVSTTSSYLFGGTDLLTGAFHCTDCHQGENAFIAHYGDHPTNLGPSNPQNLLDPNLWFPSQWYDPIVPAGFSPNPPPGNYASFPGSSVCLSCHSGRTNAGRLPDLSATNSAQGGGLCSILANVTNGNSVDRMPPSSAGCAGNCSNTQTFPRALLNLCNDVNLATRPGASAWQSSTYGTAAASRGIDGNTDGNWSHNSVFHTMNTDTNDWNGTFGGWWEQDHSLQNALGTLAVNGNDVFGVDHFSGSAGPALQNDSTNNTWTALNASVKELSISGNIKPLVNGVATPPTLWALGSSGAVSRFSGGTFMSVGGVFTASHIAAGDGDHPWAISTDGKTLFRFDGSTFQPMLMLPWEYFIAGSHSTWKITMVAVGSDDDAWVVDTGGNVYHQVGGAAPSTDVFHFPAGIAWQLATPNFAGNWGQVNAIAVANRNSVWVTTSSPSGLFNYVAPTSIGSSLPPSVNDPASTSWQHHCLSTSTCAGANFNAISIGKVDGSVWAVTTTGGIYQVDESKNVFKTDANGVHDVSSTDYSLVNIAGPGGTVGQVMSGGHPGWGDHQVIATSSTNGGTAYYTNGYYGKLPIPGGPTWTVDLGGVYHVDQINLWNRTDCCQDRLSHFRILYYDGTAWVVGSDQTNTVFTSSSPQEYSIPVNFNTEYVMVQRIPNSDPNSNYLHLAEVQVMGSPNQLPQQSQF